MVRRVLLGLQAGVALVVVRQRDADAAMSERGEVLGHQARAGLVVDVDVEHPGLGVEVHAREREPAGEDDLHAGVVGVDAGEDEAVHEGGLDERGAAPLDARDEREAQPLLLASRGHAVQELDGAGSVNAIVSG